MPRISGMVNFPAEAETSQAVTGFPYFGRAFFSSDLFPISIDDYLGFPVKFHVSGPLDLDSRFVLYITMSPVIEHELPETWIFSFSNSNPGGP